MKNSITKLLDLVILIAGIFFFSLFLTDYSFIKGACVSNITIPTIILFLVLVFRLIISSESFKESPVYKILSFSKPYEEKVLVSLFIFYLFAMFFIISLARHYSLASSSYDLGIFDQAIWNTSRGNLLFSSIKGNINLLGDHFEPILLFIAPFYKVLPGTIFLLGLQAMLLALAVIPLYLITRKKITSKFLVFAFIISFVLSKALRGVALSDFHPEAFILPLIFWAYYFLIEKKNYWLFMSLFFLVLCKEDMSLIVSLIGIFTFFSLKRRRLGLFLFIIGLVLFIVETKFIIPYFNPKAEYPYMNRLPLGLTLKDNLIVLCSHPSKIFELFFTEGKFEYYIKLLCPVIFLPFISLSHYVLFLVPMLKNALPTDANFSGWYNITSHYTACVIPFVYISAISAAAYLISKFKSKKIGIVLGALILLSSLLFFSKTDVYKLNKFLCTINEKNTFDRIALLKLIPKDASVSANFNLVPHLAHRTYVFDWHPKSRMSKISEYIVIDYHLLDYLTANDKLLIDGYLKSIKEIGYEIYFINENKDFVIYRNPAFDFKEVEKVYF